MQVPSNVRLLVHCHLSKLSALIQISGLFLFCPLNFHFFMPDPIGWSAWILFRFYRSRPSAFILSFIQHPHFHIAEKNLALKSIPVLSSPEFSQHQCSYQNTTNIRGLPRCSKEWLLTMTSWFAKSTRDWSWVDISVYKCLKSNVNCAKGHARPKDVSIRTHKDSWNRIERS